MGRLRIEDGEPRLTVTVQLRGDDAERWWALAHVLGQKSSVTETAQMARRAMLAWIEALLAEDEMRERVEALVAAEQAYRVERAADLDALQARRLRLVK